MHRETRIRQETVLIEQAEARLDAALGIHLDDLEAWFDQLEINENAPMPPQGRKSASRI